MRDVTDPLVFFAIFGIMLLFALFVVSAVEGKGIFYVSFWILLIISIVIIEIIFLFDKEEPYKDRSKFWFTIERKFIAFLWVLLGSICINGVILLVEFLINNLEILKWVGIVALVILGIGGYVALNSLKYRWKK